MIFYVGLHHPNHARHFQRCMVSVKRLDGRRSGFPAREWMMDSGAFTEISRYGRYRDTPARYAAKVRRWAHARVGRLVAAVSQDYMCEPLILQKTGLAVAEHQRMTVDRYAEIRDLVGPCCYVMPVLQGFWPDEYLACLDLYGDLIAPGQWVGVGSVCKRNADVGAIEQVLGTIHGARPDLLLHGFGVKLTALASSVVRTCLHSADSMAWSFAARKDGRDANDWREARAFVDRIDGQAVRERSFQPTLF
jgi:hypothetical protein